MLLVILSQANSQNTELLSKFKVSSEKLGFKYTVKSAPISIKDFLIHKCIICINVLKELEGDNILHLEDLTRETYRALENFIKIKYKTETDVDQEFLDKAKRSEIKNQDFWILKNNDETIICIYKTEKPNKYTHELSLSEVDLLSQITKTFGGKIQLN